MEKTVIGLVEKVSLNGHTVLARIDTGAAVSSLDLTLAGKLKLGPLIAKKIIVSAHGKRERPVIETTIILKGREITAKFTVIGREHMKYPVLIGRNILKENFLIDPSLPEGDL